MTSFLSTLLPLLPQVLIAIFVIWLASILLNLYERHQKLKEFGVAGPSPLTSLFRVFLLLDKNFYRSDLPLIQKYGKVFATTQADRVSLFVADVNVLKTLLVRDFNHFLDRANRGTKRIYFSKFLTALEGQEWKDTRAIMSPTFTSGKMKAMIHLMNDCLKPLVTRIDRTLGQDIDMKDLFGCFTMDVIARCAFAVETNTHDDVNHPFVVNARKFFSFPAWKILLSVFLPAFIRKYATPAFGNVEAANYLAKVSQHVIDERRKKGSLKAENRNYNDLIQLMLEASDQQQTDQSSEKTSKKTLTDEEIIGNAILVLVAGFETTASTLTFASHALATNPDVQERVFNEVTQAVRANGGKLDYDTLFSLSYLDAVVHETLRMYPPVIRTERTCSEDYSFNYEGREIHLKKGHGISIPIYAVHHMEEYYPEPEKFKPERFLPENKDSQNTYAFLSFVIGPRNCIGMRFALMELKLALATIVSQYRFVKSPRTSDPLDLSPTTILMNPREVVLKFEKRL